MRARNALKCGDLELSQGNSKVKDTLIFNLCPALNCPWRNSSLCKVQEMDRAGLPIRCYAISIERWRPRVFTFRQRQETYWKTHSAEQMISDLSTILRRAERRGVRFSRFRWNESGDIKTQGDALKLAKVSSFLIEQWSMSVWLYTVNRRAVPVLKKNCPDLVVKGSGWAGPDGQTIALFPGMPLPKGYKECPGDCSSCSFCTTPSVNVAFMAHGGKANGFSCLKPGEGVTLLRKHYAL